MKNKKRPAETIRILILLTRPHAYTEWKDFWGFDENDKIVIFNGKEIHCFQKIPEPTYVKSLVKPPNDFVIFVYTYWFIKQKQNEQLADFVKSIQEFAMDNRHEFKIKIHPHQGGEGYDIYENLINSFGNVPCESYNLGDYPEINKLARPWRELQKKLKEVRNF